MSNNKKVPVIDIFAGPGGLGEGFSSYRPGGRGDGGFRIALSIEKDETAHRTLRLRSFFRQFPCGEAPKEYYLHLQGTLSRDSLLTAHPKAARASANEAWNAELGRVDEILLHDRIRQSIGTVEPWVLIGGPPCQAYSLVGRSRNRGVKGYCPEQDERHVLYREYLRIISKHWPAVFVMENVKGLLSATLRHKSIFAKIIEDLSHPSSHRSRGRIAYTYRIVPLIVTDGLLDLGVQAGFAPNDFIVRAERLGVPQRRHRVILVGIRSDIKNDLPRIHQTEEHAAHEVLTDLPRIRSGVSDEPDSPEVWLAALKGVAHTRWFRLLATEYHDVAAEIIRTLEALSPPRQDRGKEFIPKSVGPTYAADWFSDDRLGGVCNHSSRRHMATDLHRYMFAACFARAKGRSPELRDFPHGLLPNHVNTTVDPDRHVFADRFRVQMRSTPSTTITSHIAKDGHYYIHYDATQCRSLTVREAARLQTFPDNYFFCGSRTAQYHQVGNAVPPMLAGHIAKTIHSLLSP